MRLRRRELRITEDHKCLRNDEPDAAALAGAGNRHALERRVVAHRVRRFAVRHLPLHVPLVEIDRGKDTVGRLEDREALDRQAAFGISAAAARAAATAAFSLCPGRAWI